MENQIRREEKIRSSNQYRHSLQGIKSTSESEPLPRSPLRHTLSHNKKSKKRPQPPPTILEDNTETGTTKSNNNVVRKNSKKAESKQAYDNHAFDAASTTDSIGSASVSIALGFVDRTSSIRTSTRSLSVVEERYCCFTRLSKCEKRLVFGVAVLAFIIVVLIVVIGILASDKNSSESTIQKVSKIFAGQ